MAICCGGKKQKVSHSITSSINNRRSSEKHNGVNDNHQSLKSNSSSATHCRSHSQFNHRPTNSNHISMPHDLSRSSTNSASSSALTYSYGTPQGSSTTNNNHYFHKNTKTIDKMDVSDNDDDDDEDDNKQKVKKPLAHSLHSQQKQSHKNSIVHADMIFYCFEILGNYLFNGKHHLGKHHSSSTNGQLVPSTIVPPKLPNEPYPLFVTWLIGSEQNLRGCIGTFTPMNLTQGKCTLNKTLFFRQILQ